MVEVLREIDKGHGVRAWHVQRRFPYVTQPVEKRKFVEKGGVLVDMKYFRMTALYKLREGDLIRIGRTKYRVTDSKRGIAGIMNFNLEVIGA